MLMANVVVFPGRVLWRQGLQLELVGKIFFYIVSKSVVQDIHSGKVSVSPFSIDSCTDVFLEDVWLQCRPKVLHQSIEYLEETSLVLREPNLGRLLRHMWVVKASQSHRRVSSSSKLRHALPKTLNNVRFMMRQLGDWTSIRFSPFKFFPVLMHSGIHWS